MDSSSALLKSDLSDSGDVEQEVTYFLRDFRLYHSDFQIDTFIVNKAGNSHPWGMYMQCLRELDSRRKILRGFIHKERELELDLSDALDEATMIAIFPRALRKKRRAQIRVDVLTFEKEELRRQQSDCERELLRLAKHAKELRRRLGKITDERRRELDLSFWRHRIKQQIAIAYLTMGGPSPDLYELVPCLPDDIRDDITHALEHSRDVATTFMKQKGIHLPEIPSQKMLK